VAYLCSSLLLFPLYEVWNKSLLTNQCYLPSLTVICSNMAIHLPPTTTKYYTILRDTFSLSGEELAMLYHLPRRLYKAPPRIPFLCV